MLYLKSQADIEGMRKAGALAARTLRHVAPLMRPGISSEDINNVVHEFIISHGAYPSPLNYRGFPKSVCTSINEVICHGIPDQHQILREGDIINVDVTVTLNGYYGDCSTMFSVGTEIPEGRRLVVDVAFECLARALAVVEHGKRMGDIGHAVQNFAEAQKCSVVRDFVGHGIGKIFQGEPAVPHYGRPQTGIKLVRGMSFTIEPMINLGHWEHRVLADGWTAVTVDGLPSAQFEHTLGIVEGGIEVFTALEDDPIVARARELGAKIVGS